MSTAIVVGSGPNGLAAAVTLAKAGLSVTVLEAADEIGGGTRTSELTVPGVVHDHCAAVHPMGIGSPFLRSLDLARYGVEWCWPEVDLAHPLDNGDAGVLMRSLDDTVAGLGPDGDSWRSLFEPLATGFDDLAADLLRPVVHLPKHPIRLARFGPRALLPATLLARRWRTERARALYGGAAAHVYHPLTQPAMASLGLMMIAIAHRYGWPVPKGGSAMITRALAMILAEHGGTVETGVRVRSIDELPPADVVMLDVAPGAAADILGGRLPSRIHRAYRRFRHAPAAYKVDLAVHEGVPWRNEACRRAGSLHIGGTLAEIVQSERDIHDGRMPKRPFVLVGQQYLADPSRSAGDVHPIWTYAHVPHGYHGDATEAVINQLERFAPGVRDRIAGVSVRSVPQLAAYNPNYVGGDIINGANTPLRLLLRPRFALDPYRTGVAGVYLCSAATPPGAGVHGMGGHNAATSALKAL